MTIFTHNRKTPKLLQFLKKSVTCIPVAYIKGLGQNFFFKNKFQKRERKYFLRVWISTPVWVTGYKLGITEFCDNVNYHF